MYHGGARRAGVIALQHRATDRGESLEAIPALRNTPAIWTMADNYRAAEYERVVRNKDCTSPMAGYGPGACEPQLYTLDAANVTVATVDLNVSMSRRQSEAIIQRLLQLEEGRPDVIALRRGYGQDEEYFIPEGYTPGIVRVENKELGVDVPLVATGAGIPLTAPTDDFCDVVTQPDYTEDRRYARYWQERCKATRPELGPEFLSDYIQQMEVFLKPIRDASWKEREKIRKAQLRYWKTYQEQAKDTPEGVVLTDPDKVKKAADDLRRVVRQVYPGIQQQSAAVSPPKPAKPAAAAGKPDKKPRKAAGKPAAAVGKKPAGTTPAVKPRAAKPAVVVKPSAAVKPRQAAGAKATVKSAVGKATSVKPKAGKAAATAKGKTAGRRSAKAAGLPSKGRNSRSAKVNIQMVGS